MLVFDTLSFYHRLEKSGFTKDQAEIVTELVRETQEKSFESLGENLATKQELQQTEHRLELRIEQTKQELQNEIHQTKFDLIKWMVTLLLAQTGILAALVKLL
ncbi:MAG: DUF1640 domain-containing protein [SAR324 cluster bacterium]|nr:DUF1640 domain-containing protein [SAR324 cluster bacterium]